MTAPAKKEYSFRLTGFIPLLLVVAPWWIGLYVIVKATLEAIF